MYCQMAKAFSVIDEERPCAAAAEYCSSHPIKQAPVNIHLITHTRLPYPHRERETFEQPVGEDAVQSAKNLRLAMSCARFPVPAFSREFICMMYD